MIERGSWNAASQGPLTEAAMHQWLAAMGYDVTCYRYAPGTVFAPHRHQVDKIDAVLSGRFRIEILGEVIELRPGDWVSVPRGVWHSAAVVGDAVVVSLDAVRLASAKSPGPA